MKTKQKQKQILWEKIKKEIEKELGNKYEISVQDLNTETNYFHPIIKLNDNEYLSAQCDLTAEYYYAVHYSNSNIKQFGIEIPITQRSFKEAIKKLKKINIKQSMQQTIIELQEIQKTINYMQELIQAKKELIKKSF